MKNFRCFSEFEIEFNNKITCILGKNGTGKSSVLEALHFGCYLRSFRTSTHKNLIQIGKESFFLQFDYESKNGLTDCISIGFSDEKDKLVKLNQKIIQSYRELISSYKSITLTSDDLTLINGGPSERRSFLNYALILFDLKFFEYFKKYRQILEHRNKVLQKSYLNSNDPEIIIWTKELWVTSLLIRAERKKYLLNIENIVNNFLSIFFNYTDSGLQVKFDYVDKTDYFEEFDFFWDFFSKKKFESEKLYKRTLFGVHLDDFLITFQNRNSKIFSSRGQQKLIIFLIKISQVLQLSDIEKSSILLIDDFLTDFDHKRVDECFQMLNNLAFQVIFTCPNYNFIENYKNYNEFSIISL